LAPSSEEEAQIGDLNLITKKVIDSDRYVTISQSTNFLRMVYIGGPAMHRAEKPA